MKFWMNRHLLMNGDNPDLLGTGGDKGNPPANEPPKNDPPKNDPPKNEPPKNDPLKGAFPENWKELLPDDIKNDPSIKSLKDVAALAKSYIHGQKLVGADKIVVPTNLTSEEEWGKIYQKLGMPETVEKYDFQAPENTDKEFLKSFKEMAHKNGILPKQAAQLFEFYGKYVNGLSEANEASAKAAFEKTVNGLKQEWGQAYDRKLSNAAGLFGQYADEDTKKFMRETGFSNHPVVLKLFSKIADSFGESKFIAPGGTGGMGITPSEAQDKINAVYKDTNHPYFHKAHPKHQEAREEMAKWHKAVIAGKKS
jgi:hypothetical protein